MDGSLWKSIDTTKYYRRIKDGQLKGLGLAASGFLRFASFRGCVQMSAETLSAIAKHCPNIERLNLTGCRLATSKAIEDVCNNMASLTQLDLAGLHGVNDSTLQVMAMNCHSLQVLNLSWCKMISGSGLMSLSKGCQELRKLNVSGCANLEDQWMRTIGLNLPKLRELCLNGCSSLTDRGLMELLWGLSVGSHKRLQDLRREKRSVTPAQALGELPASQNAYSDNDLDKGDDDFEESDVDSTEDGEDTNTSEGDQENPQACLVYLGLSQCHMLTLEALRSVSQYCNRQLRRLELSGCKNLDDEGLVHLAQRCTHLRFLDLEDITSLTDTSLRAFAVHLQKLERICLSFCENVTDQGILRMLRPSPNPTTLSTATIINSGSSSHYCRKLTHLELDSCMLITDRILLEFASVLAERKAVATERMKEKERKREERKRKLRQKREQLLTSRKRSWETQGLRHEQQSEEKSEEQARGDKRQCDQDAGVGSNKMVPVAGDGIFVSSVPVNIPNRLRHRTLASTSVSSYSSSPLQPRSVLASTSLSEEMVIKKTRPGMQVLAPTRSNSTSSTSSSSSLLSLWSSDAISRKTSTNVRARTKIVKPTIQVFDCRNITQEGVEAALNNYPTLKIRSYHSWTNPSTPPPTASALFGGSGSIEGLDAEEGGDTDDEDPDSESSTLNSSQTSLQFVQMQQEILQQQLRHRNRSLGLLQRARLGLAGPPDGYQDTRCLIL
ncbi:hypothetical protein BGX34_009099 [Mortierella sp. NVP85]|nr:hypothetical protein BGX34_009099 [Mortierella sp. NVP85]